MLAVVPASDLSPRALDGLTIAVIGYGAQGAAQALNLRDEGHTVIIGLHRGARRRPAAVADGFAVSDVNDVAARADIVLLLAPDEAHGTLYHDEIALHLKPGGVLVVGHGFSLLNGLVQPLAHHDAVLVAPKGQGRAVRSLYQAGKGVSALFAVHQDPSGLGRARGLAIAAGIGAARARVFETTVRDECETDLFGEQAVLCGGLYALIETAFETLVDAGYPAELAYFECIHELKLITDLIYDLGPAAVSERISNTAEFGATTVRAEIAAKLKPVMIAIVQRIQAGTFADGFMQDAANGFPTLKAQRARDAAHPLEAAGRIVRGEL
jgi:ketol-acid reductoisomerase